MQEWYICKYRISYIVLIVIYDSLHLWRWTIHEDFSVLHTYYDLLGMNTFYECAWKTIYVRISHEYKLLLYQNVHDFFPKIVFDLKVFRKHDLCHIRKFFSSVCHVKKGQCKGCHWRIIYGAFKWSRKVTL